MTVGMDEGPKKGASGRQAVPVLLSAVLVAVLGFVLLNLTFLVYATFQNTITSLIYGPNREGMQDFVRFDPMYLRWIFLVIMAGVFWLVHRSRLHIVLKASFLMVPFATLLVLIGIEFYQTPVAVYAISGLVGAGLLLFIYMKKEHWLYAFSAVLVMATLLIMGLLGIDI